MIFVGRRGRAEAPSRVEDRERRSLDHTCQRLTLPGMFGLSVSSLPSLTCAVCFMTLSGMLPWAAAGHAQEHLAEAARFLLRLRWRPASDTRRYMIAREWRATAAERPRTSSRLCGCLAPPSGRAVTVPHPLAQFLPKLSLRSSSFFRRCSDPSPFAQSHFIYIKKYQINNTQDGGSPTNVVATHAHATAATAAQQHANSLAKTVRLAGADV
jgi:hypothetical protein